MESVLVPWRKKKKMIKISKKITIFDDEFYVWVLFSKLRELPDGLFWHFFQKRSTILDVLKKKFGRF